MSYSKIEDFIGSHQGLIGLPSQVVRRLWRVWESVLKKTGADASAEKAMRGVLAKSYRRESGEWMRLQSVQPEHRGNRQSITVNAEDWSVCKEGIATIDAVLTREGVQNKGLKLRDVLRDAAPTFQYSAVILGHPDGVYDLENRQQIGWLDGVRYSENPGPKITGTVNVDMNDPDVPGWVKQQIRDGTFGREASIGYWCKSKKSPGMYGADEYLDIETGIVGQHYAVGVDEGACSVADGCGLGMNEATSTTADECDQWNTTAEFTLHEPDGSGQKTKLMKLDEANLSILEDRIKELEERLTDSEKTLNEKTEELETEQAKVKEMEPKLKGYEKADGERIKAAHTKLVETVTGKLGGEAEDYAEFTVDQLQGIAERLEASNIQPPAVKPGEPASEGPRPPIERKGEDFMPYKKHTVGNLVGEPLKSSPPPEEPGKRSG